MADVTMKVWRGDAAGVLLARRALGEIRPRAEGVLGPGDDEGPVGSIGLDLVEDLEQLDPHRGGHRVLLVRSVQQDRDDAVPARDLDRLHGTNSSMAGPARDAPDAAAPVP